MCFSKLLLFLNKRLLFREGLYIYSYSDTNDTCTIFNNLISVWELLTHDKDNCGMYATFKQRITTTKHFLTLKTQHFELHHPIFGQIRKCPSKSINVPLSLLWTHFLNEMFHFPPLYYLHGYDNGGPNFTLDWGWSNPCTADNSTEKWNTIAIFSPTMMRKEINMEGWRICSGKKNMWEQ